MTRILQALIALIGLLYLVMWLQLMFSPEAMVEQFALQPKGIEGLNSLRANVGILFLAGSVFCFLALWKSSGQWLLAAATLTGGAALGRLIGFIMDGISQQAAVGFVFELLIVTLFVVAHRQIYRNALK